MESLSLNDRRTTRLGFGGSLLGTTSDATSRKLLSIAYEAGIRHFDVAPMYGFGKSERLLSEALGTRLQDCTITTKYGLDPPPHSGWIGPFHRFAKAALTLFPLLKARIPAASNPPEETAFPLTAEGAAKSIEASLRALRVETIDLLLLHEATPARLQDEALLGMLVKHVEAGKIRGFGIGSRGDRVIACIREAPEYCDFVQFEWSVFSPLYPALERRQRINHGSLGSQRAGFASWLNGDADRIRRWSETVQVDLKEDGMLERLLLKASLEHNAGCIVLFSTRSEKKIRENVATAENPALAEPARLFHHLVQAEFAPDA